MNYKQAQLKYLNRRLDEMASLEDLLIQKNFPEASCLFHRVKGSASGLRFSRLAELAERLEWACQKSSEQTGQLFRNYRDTVDRMKGEIATP